MSTQSLQIVISVRYVFLQLSLSKMSLTGYFELVSITTHTIRGDLSARSSFCVRAVKTAEQNYSARQKLENGIGFPTPAELQAMRSERGG